MSIAWQFVENDWTSDAELIAVLPRSKQLLITAFWYHSEVSNGGSEQFYFNHHDQAPALLCECLKIIGFDEGANAVRESWAIFRDPLSREQRRNDMATLSMEDLDNHFSPCENIVFEGREDGLVYRLDEWLETQQGDSVGRPNERP